MQAAPVRRSGFTLIELVVTLTLVSVLALVAVPLYEVTVTRAKESELRAALRQIRTALDAYKAATDTGVVAKDAATSGFPPSLMVLVQGVDTVATPLAGANYGSTPAAAQGGVPGYAGNGSPASGTPANSTNMNTIPPHMVFLRQIPRDPFFEDQSVAPDQQWNVRAYGAQPGDYSGGVDVYDVSTKSTAIGLNGVPYKDW